MMTTDDDTCPVCDHRLVWHKRTGWTCPWCDAQDEDR